MKNTLVVSRILVTATLCMLFTIIGRADSFVFTSVNVPGSTSTVAAGINTGGQVVGYYTDSGGNQHGFLDTGGTFTSIDAPGATSTYAFAINSSGQIAGEYVDATGATYAFV